MRHRACVPSIARMSGDPQPDRSIQTAQRTPDHIDLHFAPQQSVCFGITYFNTQHRYHCIECSATAGGSLRLRTSRTGRSRRSTGAWLLADRIGCSAVMSGRLPTPVQSEHDECSAALPRRETREYMHRNRSHGPSISPGCPARAISQSYVTVCWRAACVVPFARTTVSGMKVLR